MFQDGVRIPTNALLDAREMQNVGHKNFSKVDDGLIAIVEGECVEKCYDNTVGTKFCEGFLVVTPLS